MSFISVEPQSRVFLESHSNSLLTQFDIQLEIIADRYLAFFQERPVNIIRVLLRRIEVSYISSLRKLHREATVVDAPFDPRAEPTTTRTAWDKVRDSLEGVVAEAKTQQAFVDILDNDETEDRTRKRVEEGLEESAAKYADHAENTILKLQQAYLKKHNPRQYAQPTDVSQGYQDGLNRRIGNKVSALFGGRQEDLGGPESSKSEEVSDDDCRRAVALLNTFRLKRVENLGDGYDCLGKLVFTPIVMDALVNYMDGLTEACTKRGNLATNTGAEVENALTGADTSGLRMSLGHALAFSIPPLTLYCNYRPDAYSDLIFGVPLVNLTIDVPKVIRMCIEEVEKRGLDTHKIYSLRRRFESEQSFSFDSTDNIHSVAMLLKRYLWDLPEPLLMLSLEDCRQYRQNRARYTENDCFVLRSRIRELHPVHRASSLEAVLQHLLLVASHSEKNAMNVKALAAQFCYTVFRGNAVLEGGVHAKKLVMEDLIQNAYTLFDEHPPQSSFSTSQSDSPVEGRLTSLLGLSLSQ
ncbi:Rho GTPase activation protein, partial [Lactarius hengduanensis]